MVKERIHLVSPVEAAAAAVKILAILAVHQIQPDRELNQVSRNLQIAQITVNPVPSEDITACLEAEAEAAQGAEEDQRVVIQVVSEVLELQLIWVNYSFKPLADKYGGRGVVEQLNQVVPAVQGVTRGRLTPAVEQQAIREWGVQVHKITAPEEVQVHLVVPVVPVVEELLSSSLLKAVQCM